MTNKRDVLKKVLKNYGKGGPGLTGKQNGDFNIPSSISGPENGTGHLSGIDLPNAQESAATFAASNQPNVHGTGKNLTMDTNGVRTAGSPSQAQPLNQGRMRKVLKSIITK